MTSTADLTSQADLTITELCTQLDIDPAALVRLLTPTKTGHARRRSDHLTIADVCAELGIARSTFYDWRAAKKAPKCIKLPNGDIRIRRTDLDSWLRNLEDAA